MSKNLPELKFTDTGVSETDDPNVSLVTIKFASNEFRPYTESDNDDPFALLSQKVEIKLLVEHENNPLLSELQGLALDRVANILKNELQKIKSKANSL